MRETADDWKLLRSIKYVVHTILNGICDVKSHEDMYSEIHMHLKFARIFVSELILKI